MNVAFKNPVENKDRLDSLVQTLFRPMGADGVYARTARYEQVVEALTDSHLAASRARHRGAAVSARHEPPPTGEVGLPQELSRIFSAA